ncbi:MAG: glycoside hydrolase 43 family protein [Opitutales bacterium]
MKIPALASLALLVAPLLHALDGHATDNPVIWADVPDPAIIRVGDTYYMSSTTMHLSPGLPIMKSTDLLNWELVSYAYDTLASNDAFHLNRGNSAYGRGTWASSLRFHDGLYYASTFSFTTGRTYIFTTPDIEEGSWTKHSFEPALHDHSLFFDDDGRVYMIPGGGDLRLVELEPDFSGIKEGGINELIIPQAHAVAGDDIMLPAEGSQLRKVDGRYYLLNITWPQDGMRTVIVHRADRLTGPWEGRVALQDEGIAQGGLIDTPEGDWYALLFGDRGAVGRIPYLVPVHWEDGWPVFGVDGKVPADLPLPAENEGMDAIVGSDDFERAAGDAALPLFWQWNHNPVNSAWSVTARPGFLRLATVGRASDLERARNTLTQRTFGPTSSATTRLDVSALRPGDVAGLTAFAAPYGYIAVAAEEDRKHLVMINASGDAPVEVARVPLESDLVELRVDCDFRNQVDEATFFYRTEGGDWKPLGDTLHMRYTLEHFMGYRFGLFAFATAQPGGHADFDYFQLGTELLGEE